jgi:flavin reductase (DIM6/NTAB) family NADH-FMN oxidoreductase RutF
MPDQENFIRIPAAKIDENVISLIRDQWMLITGTKPDGTYNTMTACWGGIGHVWGYNVAYIFVRPQRYTFEFTESGNRVTLSFFTEKYRNALKLCGAKSGRDTDKAKASGITPAKAENGAIYFSEAKLVLVCRKLYGDFIREDNFCDTDVLKNYPAKDFHKLYVIAIEEVLCKN